MCAVTIRLQADLTGITPDHLGGFFVGWPNPPAPDTFYRLLAGSYRISLAVDEEAGHMVGFAQAISDGVLTAFIPLLEVRPEYQGAGLGRRLMEDLTAQLGHLYAVDLACEDDLVPFYARLGYARSTAMIRRNYQHQRGTPPA